MLIARKTARALMAAGLTCGIQAHASQADFELPPPQDSKPTLQLWATHYYVHAASSALSGVPFKNKSGKVLSDNVSRRDWCLAAIEGTIQVLYDNALRTLNFSGRGQTSQVDCAAVLKISPAKNPWITATGKSYFSVARGAFGDGVQGFKLVPYRTIAVDRSTVPFGTVLFVAEAKGAQIRTPSGMLLKHDGYFFAGDTGSAIRGKHVDVFCGTELRNRLPGLVSSNKSRTFSAVIIQDPGINAALLALHK